MSTDLSIDIVDAYDVNLTRTTPTRLSMSRYGLAATTVGDYALFGGGYDSSTNFSTVDAYDSNLTRSTPTALSVRRTFLSATTLGNYALFGGGYGNSDHLPTVDAYDSNLTRSTPTALGVGRNSLAATTVGDYALFGGGYGSSYSAAVDAYYINNQVQVYPGTKYKLGSMSDEATSDSMQMITTTAPITGYIKIKDATIN